MENSGVNESEPAAEHLPAPEANDQPAITDVVFDRNMLDTPLMVMTSIVAGIVLLVLAILFKNLTLPLGVKYTTVAAAAAGAGALVWAGLLSLRKRGSSRVRRALASSVDTDLASRIKGVLSITCSLCPQRLVKETVKTLAAEGRLGTTIRIAPRGQVTPIDAISVPFEPRQLTEVAEVQSAGSWQTDTHSDADGAAGSHLAGNTSPAAVPCGLRRSFILKGGWILFAIWIINWLIAVFDSFRRRRVTIHLICWTLSLLVFLLIPVGSNWLASKQWLAVPGGIVMRKGAWLKRRWGIHLFDRRRSVLLMYKLHRRQWALVVADADACESTIGTKPELEATLRAWLSPLSPPKPEQLSELS